MTKKPTIQWNDQILLAIADVDETIAEVYTPAEPAMIGALTTFLQEGRKLFMVTGGSLQRVMRDITDQIKPELRSNILISHCSGAEVWGFMPDGQLRTKAFYSVYDETFNGDMRLRWRAAVRQLVDEFQLRTHPAQPKTVFWEKIGRDPHDVMLDDRGPQITLEVVNGLDLSAEQQQSFSQPTPADHEGHYDLRLALLQRAKELFEQMNVLITPRLAGVFALDFAVEGSSKTTSIQYVLSSAEVLSTLGLQIADLTNPADIEIWGDKFSAVRGGTDRHMSEAVSPKVRSIDFREEDPRELPQGYNIVPWEGQYHLHHGLLEYLQSRA